MSSAKESAREIERGDIWVVDLPKAPGREQGGQRPTIVVQDGSYGEKSPLILVVSLTSNLATERFPATVRIEPSPTNGLIVTSVAMVFQLRAVDRRRFLRRIGVLSSDDLAAVLRELNR